MYPKGPLTMLSRLLHRKSKPMEPETAQQKMKNISRVLAEKTSSKKSVGFDDAEYFIDILHRLQANEQGTYLTDMLFMQLAYDNGNTSYIEPFVEAAYKHNHPEKSFLGKMYGDFATSRIPEAAGYNNATSLVRKLLDDRFYSISDFPVHSLSILGRAGVAVPDNNQETLLYRALASNTPIEQIQSTLANLKLDPEGVKNAQGRTVLHNLMADYQYGDTSKLEHMLNRAYMLALEPSADIFGRYPDDFGTPATRLMYAQYFEAQTQEPLPALASYLQSTVHNFSGLGSIGARNTEVYLKAISPVDATPRSTLFEHVLHSHNMAVISELQRLIEPTTRQHTDIERTLPYVFIERYACSAKAKPEIVEQVFALLQDQTPRDLSTALGYFLMRRDAYYKNYDVGAFRLAQYTPAIEKVMAYQAQMGLVDLLKLEKPKLDIIAGGFELPGEPTM